MQGGAPPAGEELFSALEAFRLALEAWGRALRDYAAEADSAGRAALRERWPAAVAALAPPPGAAPLRPPEEAGGPRGLALAAGAAGAALEARERGLAAAAGVVLDPGVRASLLAGLSRTFSEDLAGLGRAVHIASLGRLAARRQLAGAAASLGGRFAAELAAAPPAPGLVAASIRGAALVCRSLAGDVGAQASLRAAKDEALGCAADSPAGAEADALALRDYHILHSMIYFPGRLGPPGETPEAAAGRGRPGFRGRPDFARQPRGGPRDGHRGRGAFRGRRFGGGAGGGFDAAAEGAAGEGGAEEDAAAEGGAGEDAAAAEEDTGAEGDAAAEERWAGGLVDLTLPQARLDVCYDLGRLIDRGRAAEFGPLASAASGLNYRLVERLRTISAAPLPARPPPRGRARCDAAGEGAPRCAPAAAVPVAPLAVSTDGGRSRRFLAPPTPPAWAAGGTWAPFAGGLPRAAALAEAEEAAAPAHPGDAGLGADLRRAFEAAVAGGTLPAGEALPDRLRDELVAAFEAEASLRPPEDARAYRELVAGEEVPGFVRAAVGRLAEAEVRQFLLGPQVAGGLRLRAGFRALEREARLTRALHVLDASRAVWRRLREAFVPEAEAFAAPPGRRRLDLLRAAFRRLAGAVAQGGLAVAPPSLKLYAAVTPPPAPAPRPPAPAD